VVKFRIKIHPLFLIFGAFLMLIGSGYLFLAYILAAVLHEFAHAVAASFYGIRSENITLYPFGAVMFGQYGKLKPSQETIVALAGPVFNLIVSVVFTAMWWLAPVLYAYTDVFVIVNVSMAVFNLLPVYPLDGGRVFASLLKLKTGEVKALKTVRFLGYFAAGFFMLFYICTVFTKINYSFIAVSFFMLTALFDKENRGRTSGIFSPPSANYKYGVEVRTLKADGDLTLLQLFRLMSPQYYYIIDVVSEGKSVKTFTHGDIENILVLNSGQTRLKDIRE